MTVDFEREGWVRPVSEGERFFYDHAGWSYDPKTETAEEGRWRSARDLRSAEVHAEREGWYVEWESDPDGDYMDADTEWADWPHYQATLYDQDGNILTSLCGVMFADRGDETSDPYARVVAAELAEEARDEQRNGRVA